MTRQIAGDLLAFVAIVVLAVAAFVVLPVMGGPVP